MPTGLRAAARAHHPDEWGYPQLVDRQVPASLAKRPGGPSPTARRLRCCSPRHL